MLDDAVVIAGPAGRASLRESPGHAAVEVLERSRPDRVRDPVAVRPDGIVVQLLLVEEVERGLRSFAVGDVAEGLAATVGVEAAFEPLRVGLERPDHGDALRLARVLAGDERRDVPDLLLAQLALERGHPAASAPHLVDDLVEGRVRLVEVRADRAARAGGLERVTAAAACLGEDSG